MNAQILVQILPFTLTGFLIALMGIFNQLRKGSRDILVFQVVAFLTGLGSIIIITRLMVELVYKAHF